MLSSHASAPPTWSQMAFQCPAPAGSTLSTFCSTWPAGGWRTPSPAAQGKEPDASASLGAACQHQLTRRLTLRSRCCGPEGEVTDGHATSLSTTEDGDIGRPGSGNACRGLARHGARRGPSSWPNCPRVHGPFSVTLSGQTLSLQFCFCFLKARLEKNRYVALSDERLRYFPIPFKLDGFHLKGLDSRPFVPGRLALPL